MNYGRHYSSIIKYLSALCINSRMVFNKIKLKTHVFNQRLFVGSMIGLNFPNCSNAMQESKKYEVDIDYCFRCKGAWLDRGEIDKIANVQS